MYTLESNTVYVERMGTIRSGHEEITDNLDCLRAGNLGRMQSHKPICMSGRG